MKLVIFIAKPTVIIVIIIKYGATVLPSCFWPREITIIMEISYMTDNPIQTAEFLPCPKSGTRRPNICFVPVPRGKKPA
jgi:hypothetical protein